MKIIAGIVASALLCAGALAEDCPKLAIYARIPLQHVQGWPAELVPVEIQGVQKRMLLDTGAFFSTLNLKTVNELKLRVEAASMRLVGVTGASTDRFTRASFVIGGMKGEGIQFMVDGSDFGDTGVVGLLGAQILTNYDLSIDFGTHTLDLVSPNHCDGQVVYWAERPISVVPITLRDRWAIVLPVMLDGKEVTAQLDTGASVTTLEKGTAGRYFGIVTGAADTPEAGIVNGDKGTPVWKHRFKSLSIAGIEVSNPEVDIIPDKMTDKLNSWSTGSLLDQHANGNHEQPPMLLGMNVLKHLHLYIAYKEKKLYITPAGAAPTK